MFPPDRVYPPTLTGILILVVLSSAVTTYFLFRFRAQGGASLTISGVISAVITLAIAYLLVSPFVLTYKIEPAAIAVRGVWGGWLSFPREAVVGVEPTYFSGTARSNGLASPAIFFGEFRTRQHGETLLYGGKDEGQAVMLKLADGTQVILTPQDREGFLKAAAEQGYPLLTQATKGEGSYGETS